jgi:hypothetical protein
MLVHENSELINYLLPLYPKEVDIFIHIDKSKSLEINPTPNVKSIISKVECEWGKFSLVEATIELMKEAGTNYDYYHLVSGCCIPLCTQNNLDKLEYPKCYMQCIDIIEEHIYFGSQWWTLPKPAIEYLLTIKFEHTDYQYLCPDEYVIQTEIFKKFPDIIIRDNKRFIEMDGVHARQITKEDNLEGYLFARKVNLDYFNNN